MALTRLQAWMDSVQTDPDIIIITELNNWQQGITSTTIVPFTLQSVLNQQNDIKWQPFLEGWTTFEWKMIQQAYYHFLQMKSTGK
jgi:hypothetical protein